MPATLTGLSPQAPHDRTYAIEFHAQGLTIPKELDTSSVAWQLSFADITSGPGMAPSMYGVTGGGHAFAVFATVILALKAFVRAHNRPFIVFTAKEASRQKLYDRFVRMVKSTVSGMHGFRLINTPAVKSVLGGSSPGLSSYVIVPTHISMRIVAKMIGAWHKNFGWTNAATAEFLGSL